MLNILYFQGPSGEQGPRGEVGLKGDKVGGNATKPHPSNQYFQLLLNLA